MKSHFRLDFTFPRNYEAKILESPPPVHPLEKLYHYPVELEEGDRSGAYLRVTPQKGRAWNGFFALGFESDQVISALCSCPDPDFVCVVVGGYAYVVKASAPTSWFQVEQRPVMELRAIAENELILFTGFTTISAVGRSGLAWTTDRLSWEGVEVTDIAGGKLRGLGWDAFADKHVPFEVDLLTGQHSGGAWPGQNPQR